MAIQTAPERTANPRVCWSIREEVAHLRAMGLETVLQWVPGHCGLKGNESADRAAKSALSHVAVGVGVPPSPSEARNRLKRALYNEWQEDWDVSGRGRFRFHLRRKIKAHTPMRLNRAVEAVITRLRLGHARTKVYLAYTQQEPSPECECGEIEDVPHVLLHCKLHRRESSLDEKFLFSPTECSQLLFPSGTDGWQRFVLRRLAIFLLRTGLLARL